MAKCINDVSEMATELIKDKNRDGYTQRLYKAQSDEHKGEMLSSEIEMGTNALLKTDRVNFSDINDVKRRTVAYFQACNDAQVYPSVMGLTTYGFGVSRQALSKFLLSHPNSEVAEFIDKAKDIMADILTNQSLYNNANSVQAIFQLKNHFGHADTQRMELQPVQMKMNEEDREALAEEIANRYLIDEE